VGEIASIAMYSTCLFCKKSLGANEAIERFPIGRRLAFDAAKGRLWVVCRKCERWNLTPLETRWEAIEECERSFRETKLRTSTDQIGLARLGEGLELVRVGKPLRPEFAAWRYGDQFGARRRRHYIQTGAMVVAAATIPIAGPALGLSLGALGMGHVNIANFALMMYDRMKVLARVEAPDGRILVVRRWHALDTEMIAPKGDQPWGLRILHREGDGDVPWWRYTSDKAQTDLRGEHAVRAAAQILPRLNSKGASARVVQDAVAVVARSDGPVGAFSDAAHLAARTRSWNDFGKGALLARVDPEIRLALEMISHEDAERRALEGELHLLEEAWKEAEEIAGISDNLFLPSEVSTRLSQMKAEQK
jgi:hypothetical protein